MEGRGKGVDSFALWSNSIWVQFLKNFVTDRISAKYYCSIIKEYYYYNATNCFQDLNNLDEN